MTSTSRQRRINHDPQLVRKRYPLEAIWLGDQILLALDQYRLLTNQQVGELLFRQTLTAANTLRSDRMVQKATNETLRRLIDTDLVTRTPVTLTHRLTRRRYDSHLNLLTAQGAEIVQARYNNAETGQRVRWHPDLHSNFRYSHPDHLIQINDVAIHLHRAIWALGGTVLLWQDDAQLHSAIPGLVPDGLAMVEMPSGRTSVLFIEVDRGTMPIGRGTRQGSSWSGKVERYGHYFQHSYRQHDYLFDLGFDPRDLTHPLVLTVTPNPGRLSTLREGTAAGGGGDAYWHTDFGLIYDHPERGIDNWLALTRPIWLTPTSDDPRSLADHLGT